MIEGYRDSDYNSIINELCPEIKDNKPGKPLHTRRLPFLRNVITVGFRMPGALTWEESLAYAERTPIEEIRRMAAAVNVNDVCNMQYTSGTTGFPKGVMLTHYNIVNDGKSIGDGMDLSTADRMMIQVPMFHCFGMVLAMTATMTHGGTILPIPYFSPKSSLACINNEHITAFHGVPTMFIAMLSHEDFPKTDFSYMRTGIMAGSPCPIAVMRDVVEKMHMPEIVIVYGQTEASPGCTMSRTTDSLEVRVTTVGSAFPEVECKIVDPETGDIAPIGQDGEICCRGFNNMKGYYNMPEQTAKCIDENGWLHSGDIGRMDEEGYYFITGRLKDLIIRGGENISPKEVEDFLGTMPGVKDVAVVGCPSKKYGEQPAAFIIPSDGANLQEGDVADFCRNKISWFKIPKYVHFLDVFPMTASQKIQKYKLREMAHELWPDA
jgi:fatty-acyl-CoA synthase